MEQTTATRTFTKKSLSLTQAEEMIAAAKRKAAEMGLQGAIAICDEAGTLKAFAAMDGAPLLAIKIAQDKAYTAVGFGLSTDEWFNFIQNDQPLLVGAPTGIERLIVFGGGYPIREDGQIIGGIGVSGGHYTQDMEIAKAGLDVFTA